MAENQRNIPNIVIVRRPTVIEPDVVDITKLSDQQIGQARANIRGRRGGANTEILASLLALVPTVALTVSTGGLAAPTLLPPAAGLIDGIRRRAHLYRRGITTALDDHRLEEAAERYYTERNPAIAAQRQEQTRQRWAEAEAVTEGARSRVATINSNKTELANRTRWGEQSPRTVYLAQDTTPARVSAAQQALETAREAEVGPREEHARRVTITTNARQADRTLVNKTWRRPAKPTKSQ